MFAQDNDKIIVKYTFEADVGENAYRNFEASIELTWNEIFHRVSPYMIDATYESNIAVHISRFIEEEHRDLLYKKKDLHIRHVFNTLLNGNDFQTIKIQLLALNLITKGAKPSFWKLSPYGETIMIKLRALKRASAEEKIKSPKSEVLNLIQLS